MIYTKMTKLALKLCFEAHKEQTDKCGIPYVFHPFHLAEQMTDENTVAVALLHDVVEDTDVTLEDLREAGFTDQVVEAVALMTHSPDVPYMDYVAAIKTNPIARAVKLADLRHNSDVTRLDVISPKDLERVKKYSDAIQRIIETINFNEETNITDDEEIQEQIQTIQNVPQDFLFVLKEITSRKYIIKITIEFSKLFKINTIALFDTRAYLNCIK